MNPGADAARLTWSRGGEPGAVRPRMSCPRFASWARPAPGDIIMETQFGHERYWTKVIEDRSAGSVGLRLHRERFGKTAVAAEVIFWDASGTYFVQTLDGDVPIEIIERVVAEAKQH